MVHAVVHAVGQTPSHVHALGQTPSHAPWDRHPHAPLVRHWGAPLGQTSVSSVNKCSKNFPFNESILRARYVLATLPVIRGNTYVEINCNIRGNIRDFSA